MVEALLKEPDGQPSEVFASILAEIATEIEHCDQTSREGRAASIDPKRLDGAAQRSRAEDSEFVASRLRAGQAALQPHHAAALAREAYERWSVEADDVELQAAQAADALLETYQTATKLLVKVFELMSQVDQKVDRINSTAPDNVMRRLKCVEAVARKVSAVGSPTFVNQVRLPKLVVGGTDATMLWPPPAPNWAADYVASIAAACGVPSHADDHNWEFVFDEAVGHYVHRRKAGAPPAPPLIYRGPPPMQPGETPYQYTLRMQQMNVEASQRHIAEGEARERETQRLNAEAAARAEAHVAEQRRLAAGG